MATVTRDGDPLMTPKEAAAYVGVKIRQQPYALQTFYNMVSDGDMIAPDEIRRTRPRWRQSTLDAWISTQVITPATGAAAPVRPAGAR